MPPGKLRAFGCDHDAEISSAGVALANRFGHLVNIERNFGDQNDVGAAGDAAISRDPAGIASHHFHHDHAIVRLGRRMHPVNGFGGHIHGGVEAEGEVGARQIIVNRLRNANHF